VVIRYVSPVAIGPAAYDPIANPNPINTNAIFLNFAICFLPSFGVVLSGEFKESNPIFEVDFSLIPPSRFYERGCQHKHLNADRPTGTKPIVAASPPSV